MPRVLTSSIDRRLLNLVITTKPKPKPKPHTMVAKKYLCNAPRQEVWDEKVEAMLKSLRGNMKQKRSYLRKTLKGLQEEQ
jgi:hypothetical protein